MSLRVLVADDAAFIRAALRGVLENSGFRVVGEAADGEEAVEKFRVLKPDIVTMDIVMPKMDGISATRKIMSIDPSARVIVCSAMGHKHIVLEALRVGARDFLVKPFQPERVVAAINRACGDEQSV